MAKSSSVIRFGIIGCAEIAKKLSGAIQATPNATLVAVGSRSLDKARRFVEDNGLSGTAVRAYGGYQEVLEDPCVDAVYVPLPTTMHVEWATKAAEKRKHVLLEKPAALSVEDLDVILAACERNRVQFMDGTMWMHHPRTRKMEETFRDSTRFGEVKWVHSSMTVPFGEDFLKNNIRVKPDLDALGALGDVGWYCIRAILWAHSFRLPSTVVATHGAVTNSVDVILSCGATLQWHDGTFATFHCSFLSYLSMELFVVGTRGSIHASDFVKPFSDFINTPIAKDSASFTVGENFEIPKQYLVETEMPQEVLMVAEFTSLVERIKNGGTTEAKWSEITRKTQLVLDAVKKSIDDGYRAVDIDSC